MKKFYGTAVFVFLIAVFSCSKDPLSPQAKPIASLNVTPDTALISNALFTIDASGSRCSGVPVSDLWARFTWDYGLNPDSVVWENWTSLQSILSSPPSISYTLDTNQSFPITKIIALEVSNTNGISDTAVDTVIIIKN
ncbi:hypothetical protein JW890_09390 [candidate division WOR-3 bacterium]|nr:hypothetical protein [candidate division WOR-3 bacterium]